jgi:hypothetical protein
MHGSINIRVSSGVTGKSLRRRHSSENCLNLSSRRMNSSPGLDADRVPLIIERVA